MSYFTGAFPFFSWFTAEPPLLVLCRVDRSLLGVRILDSSGIAGELAVGGSQTIQLLEVKSSSDSDLRNIRQYLGFSRFYCRAVGLGYGDSQCLVPLGRASVIDQKWPSTTSLTPRPCAFMSILTPLTVSHFSSRCFPVLPLSLALLLSSMVLGSRWSGKSWTL